MYDEFEDAGRKRTRRQPRTWLVIVLAVVVALAVVGGAVPALLNHHRIDRSNGLAVKYGLASSTKHVSLMARCTAALRNDYDTSSAAWKAALPPGGVAVLTPKICALGVQEGVVRQDGTMTPDDTDNVGFAVIERMGLARVQTLIFNELAVTPYRLAKAGHVTRWDRCAAMGYSAYDGQTAKAKSDFPPRARFFQAVRDACTNGIARGLVPASGAPSRRDTALLLGEALARPSR